MFVQKSSTLFCKSYYFSRPGLVSCRCVPGLNIEILRTTYRTDLGNAFIIDSYIKN